MAHGTHQADDGIGAAGGSRVPSHALPILHFGLIGLAQVIDVTTSSHVLAAMEEVFELDAAIVPVFYVMQQARNAQATGPLSGSGPY